MTPDLSVLNESWGVLPETARPVTEGVWYADRYTDAVPGFPMQHGLWWTHDGSRVISLAWGTGLHFHKMLDYENYVFRGDMGDGDVCCHDTLEEATACALECIRSGKWCRPAWDAEEVDA